MLAISAPLMLWAGPEAMTHDEARHLASRTGFGAAPVEVAALIGLSYDEGVAQILAKLQTEPGTPMPAWTESWSYPNDQIWALGNTAQELFFANRWLEIGQLKQWWLTEMVQTPSPLTEKLVLFWHDHFPTSFEDHQHPQWAADQNQLFRTHAAGNFADLASAILKDSSMLVYLTNTDNEREAPNENLAREYLELFTLGEGRGYTETDVTEAARALTGHTVNDFAAGEYVFDPKVHDTGEKTILGVTGRHTADDLPRIVMEDDAFGPFIVERLWRAFVSNAPDPAEVTRLTDIWRAADWEMKPLLRAMFLSDAFWATENRGTLVKSPVDLMVGAIRTLGIEVPYMDDLAWAVEDLGQNLFLPPNVGGWPEGTDWINDASASGRATMLTYMLDYDPAPREDAASMMMMQQTASAIPSDAGPQDLSVGQVFLLEANVIGEDRGKLTVNLFDVRFQDHHWRSVTFVTDFGETDYLEFVMQVTDCAPECFAAWPYPQEDAFGWIWFDSDAIAGDDINWMSAQDRALLASLMGHLPALITASKDQPIWRGASLGGSDRLTFNQAQTASKQVADFGVQTLGTPTGQLVIAAVAPASVGLGGIAIAGMSKEDLEAIYEEQEKAANTAATPAVSYDRAADWLDAVPAGGFDSLRAEAALLALPLPEQGRRMERDASDPEALIRHIILSPYFQLN
jgi:uncharacterized protein (DUF1800 family)